MKRAFILTLIVVAAIILIQKCSPVTREAIKVVSKTSPSLFTTSKDNWMQGDEPDAVAAGAPCYDSSTGKINPLNSMGVASTGTGRSIETGLFRTGENAVRRREDGSKKDHNGIDLLADVGTPVYATCDGVIMGGYHYVKDAKPIKSDKKKGNGYGNRVSIKGTIAGDKLEVLYAHLSMVTVSPGERVVKGQIIGYTGKTGNAYNVENAHLHYEIRQNGKAINPEPYLNGMVDTQTGFVTGIICD